MDVNEKIVEEWLRLCKQQFTITNIPFKVRGPKGGSNYSNIDILASDTKGYFYDYEVKWRSVYAIGATDKETVKSLIYQIIRPERIQKIKEIIGNKNYKKILITTKIFFGRKKEEIIKEFKRNNIDVLFFEDIIPGLVESIGVLGRYDSEVLQIIRILKQFDTMIHNKNKFRKTL